MTTAITLRATKGSPLTHNEMDTNLTNLQTTADTAAASIVTLGTKAEAAALGVTASDTNMGSFTGTTISDSVTAKAALQALETAVETKANASALGVAASAANMGTFTGSTIADNQTAKVGMQSLETAVELRALAAFSYATSYAAGSIGALVNNAVWITEAPYSADPTGAADCSAALAAAWAAHPGQPIYFPPGTYRMNSKTEFFSAASIGAFGSMPKLIGAGIGKTFIDNRVANDVMWDFDADTHSPFNATMGGEISGLSFKHGAAVAASTFLRFKNAYLANIYHCHISGSSGTGQVVGIELRNGAYSDDGWNQFTLRQLWIENCAGWGIKADGDSGRNEGSFTNMDQVFIQGCGTANTAYTITAITAANPPVVSAAGHTLTNGQEVWIKDPGGMVQLGGRYTVANAVAGVSFELSGVNASAYTAYTTGGTASLISSAPSTGGMIWKGQIITMHQCAFTLNHNAATYIKGQSGLAIGFYANGTTWENNYGRHILCTGISGFTAHRIQFHANDTFTNYTGVEFDGASFSVRGVDIDGVAYRATSGSRNTTAFKISGTNATLDTCRVRNVIWDSYDLNADAPQKRFEGWLFDEIENQCQLVVASSTSLVYRARQGANAKGRASPLRLRGVNTASTTGEWIASQLPTSGRSISNASLSNSTRYYCYFYDNAGSSALSLSTTAPALDTASGYMVKSDDATRFYVGSVLTDGAAAFTTTAVGWLNPEVIYDGATQTGVPYYRWRDTTGDLRVSNAAPTSDTDGTVIGTQT